MTNARDARCSAHPYGYSTTYRAPCWRPTSAVDDTSTRRPPTPGTTFFGSSNGTFESGAASPYAATVSGDTITSTGMLSSNASPSPPMRTVVWIARAADARGHHVEAHFLAAAGAHLNDAAGRP